jgi:predicted dehydrogenase
MTKQSVNVAMIGLGFGTEFLPIYQAHPQANVAALCRRNEGELNKVGDQFGISKRYTRYEDVLADPDVDFVHINSPIADHARMSLQALDAGKHVMCTVPMATTIDECRQIVEKVAKTGLKYMMAETVVYSREFLFIKDMYDKGELGKIQYLAASHPQDMDGWPSYWEKMIPMHYATHVVSPCLALTGALVMIVILGVVAPRLAEPLAWLECEPWAEYEGGDHTLFVGRVVDFLFGDADALGFYQSRFVPVARPVPSQPPVPYDPFELPYDAP